MMLILRLLRGGGWAGLIRLVLMTAGIAVGVLATTFVATLPVVLDAKESLVAARTVRPAPNEGMDLFKFSEATDVWEGQRLGRIFIVEPKPTTPLPPGVTSIPGPGEAVVSPQLAAALHTDVALQKLVPGKVVGIIAPAGLLGPDELFAYVGVKHDELQDIHSGGGWGSLDKYLLDKQQAGLTQALALLVLPSVIVFLVVCSRLAAATRVRRYAALRLLGLRRSRTLGLAAMESGFAGGIGAVAGIGLHHLVNPMIANSGIVGFRWFPDVASQSVGTAALVVGVVVVGSATIGAAGLRKALSRPVDGRADATDGAVSPMLLSPLVFGLGGLVYPLLAAPPSTDDARERIAATELMGWVVVGSAATACIGLLLGLRPLIAAVGGLLSADRVPMAIRIAARRMVWEPASTIRLLAGIALLILVAGVGEGVMRDLAMRAGPTVINHVVRIDGSPETDPDLMRRSYQLEAAYRWTVQRSAVAPALPGESPRTPADVIRLVGTDLTTVSCHTLRELSAVPDCVNDRWYRVVREDMLGTAMDLPAGLSITYLDGQGVARAVTVPNEALVVQSGSLFGTGARAALLYTGDEPIFGWTSDMNVVFMVPGSKGELVKFKAAAALLSPGIRLQIPAENIDLLETYYHQRGVLSFGILIGFALGILAFAIAAVDRAIERRRDAVALRVLGIRIRTVRAVQIAQLVIPLLLVLLVSGFIGHLAGNAILRLNDSQRSWHLGTIEAMLPLAGIAFVVVSVAALVVVGRTLRAEDLRRE